MKKILVLVLMILIGIKANSQEITLPELLYFVKKDVSSINNLLIKKGWSLYVYKDTTQTEYASDGFAGTIWSYFTEGEIEKNSLGWIYLSHRLNEPNRVEYKFASRSAYSRFVNDIKLFKPDLVSKKFEGGILDTYFGNNYVYLVQSLPTTTHQEFSVTIFHSSDYYNEVLKKEERRKNQASIE